MKEKHNIWLFLLLITISCPRFFWFLSFPPNNFSYFSHPITHTCSGFYMWLKIWHLSFWIWLISLSRIISRSIQFPDNYVISCGLGLNENTLHRLLFLNAWFPIGRPFGEGLGHGIVGGGGSLKVDICILKTHSIPSKLSLPVAFVD